MIIGGQENIYLDKTKEYFKEVLLDYEVGNYRSAIVMLYSVVIVDLMNKLRELSDIYQIKNAQKIFKEIEKERNNDLSSKSAWEKTFIDKVHNEVKMIDDYTYAAINHLYMYRNLSAHPALNEYYELLSPTKEMTIAYIREMLDLVFTKSPILTDKVIDLLTEDVANVYPIFKNDLSGLRKYLDKKYFEKMSQPAKKKSFKAFWKFCFILTDNEDCVKNIMPNRRVLEILAEEIEDVEEFVLKDKYFESIPGTQKAKRHFLFFTSRCPYLYKSYADALVKMLDELLEEEPDLKAYSWFNKRDKREHLCYLEEREDIAYTPSIVTHMKEIYDKEGYRADFLKFCIVKFGKSRCYDEADFNYKTFIRPFLDDFDKSEYLEIFEMANANNQIYGRGAAKETNSEMISTFVEKFNDEVVISNYNNLDYNIIKRKEENQ